MFSDLELGKIGFICFGNKFAVDHFNQSSAPSNSLRSVKYYEFTLLCIVLYALQITFENVCQILSKGHFANTDKFHSVRSRSN